VKRPSGEISTESCEVIASDGESATDFRGKIARTSLPFSAAGMTTVAGTGAGAGRGAGSGAGVGLEDGVVLNAAESRGEGSDVEPAAMAGGTTGSDFGLAGAAALSVGGRVEPLRSSGLFPGSGDGLDFLDSAVGGGVGFLDGAGADDGEGPVFFLEFASG
jgi:hypothetical protein